MATIKFNDYILIKLPSENQKVVKLKPESRIALGKFGVFHATDLIGHKYGLTYDILNDRAVVSNRKEIIQDLEETENNNRKAIDDSKNQKLSYLEIEKLKKEGVEGDSTGKRLIDAIVDNHKDFENKTEYSKAKYIKRKESKFLKYFTVVKPTAFNLCQFYFEKSISKIKGMRMDSLAYMLTFANVQPHLNFLIYDDCQGLLLSAVLERLGGAGKALAIYDTEFPNYDITRFFNFEQNILDAYFPLRVDQIEEGYEQEPLFGPSDPNDPHMVARHQRRVDLRQQFDDNLNMYKNGEFDGLLIASSSVQPKTIVEKLINQLEYSRPIVIYCQHKEFMKEDPRFLLPTIQEFWLRNYQVLPNRTHPDMNGCGSSNYLLTTTYVLDLLDATPLKSKVINPETLKNLEKLNN